MKSRLLAGTAAVALALVGALLIIVYASGADQRAVASIEPKDVLVVSKAVPAGTPVSEMAASLVTKKVPASAVSTSALSSLDGKAGTVSAIDLVPGEQLLAERLITPADATDNGTVKVPAGFQEVSFQLDPQRVVGGRIAVGDHVGIALNFKDGTDKAKPDAPTTQMTLRKVLVTNVQGAPQGTPKNSDTKTQDSTTPTGAIIVTVGVNDLDANKIIFTSINGELWLTKEPLDAQDNGPAIARKDNVYK
ncbi:flagellar biosynthesis protein FlgA [Arthrobacter sp. ISL-85]|uniref:Flp pilus assembly protein CpaB n=1 Tax=Arthrobacter sp. ISL-85 TaxID=2819115 RepID=UPI001BE6C986|nr:RcpC/CpaB family pilus assembly protein [Arthrobacter sp. ISL-85]MBT2567415.1 flagellar biosynthesis protein FlgA [Arthrobacter sp. ISL-85]